MYVKIVISVWLINFEFKAACCYIYLKLCLLDLQNLMMFHEWNAIFIQKFSFSFASKFLATLLLLYFCELDYFRSTNMEDHILQVYVYHYKSQFYQVYDYCCSKFLQRKASANDSPPLAIYPAPLALWKLKIKENYF